MVRLHSVRPVRSKLPAPRQRVGLQELPDVGFVHAQSRHLHRVHVGRLDRHGEPFRARQHHPAAGEAHAGLHVDKGHLGLAAFLEPLAPGAQNALFDRDVQGPDHAFGGDDAERVARHLHGEVLVSQAHQPAQVLVRIEPVGETDQRILAVVRLGAHAGHQEGALGRDPDIPAAPRVDSDAPSVPPQPHILVLRQPGHALHGKVVADAVVVVPPADFQPGPVLLGAQNVLHGSGFGEVGGGDGSGDDQIVLVPGHRVEPRHVDLEALGGDLEAEPVVADVLGQPQQPFPDECDPKRLPRGKVGGRCEDQPAGAGEGRGALHPRLEDEHAGRGTADEVLARDIPGEDDRDPVALRYGPVGALADQGAPARVGRRGVGVPACREGEGGEGGEGGQ